jgi:hypothetical protein
VSVTISSRMDSQAAITAAEEIVAAAAARGGETRILGGIAIAVRCPSARDGQLARSFSDIDLVSASKGAPRLVQALDGLGYVPEERFNAMHGHSRLLFDHPEGAHVDVFVRRFAMCHSLDLGNRLEIHPTTIPLADLLLTKAQIAELNEKDVTDLAALFVDHPLSDDESGLNRRYVSRLLARDWGWWRTVTANLAALAGHLHGRLSPAAEDVVKAKVDDLLAVIGSEPKSLRWKARARAGDRLPWREDPEESR